MQRDWSLGDPAWAWPDTVDETGTGNVGSSRYLPVIQVRDDGYTWTVAKVFVDEGDQDMADDARLIAAAPDLLAALKRIMFDVGDGLNCDPNLDTLAQCRQAIDKAEGK